MPSSTSILSDKVEQFPHGRQQEPEQTLAFRRTLQTAVLHVQSASRPEVQAGDLLAAMLQQHKSFASQLLEGQGVTRLDILNFISHGISKVPPIPSSSNTSTSSGDGDAPAGQGEEGKASARDPLVAYTVNLSARAAAGELDPLIGRNTELQRTMEVLCRRRKNNPVFVGEAGVGKTALAEGLAQRLLMPDVPSVLKGAEVYSLDTTALLAGTRFRGDFEERFKAVVAALGKRAKPILFIDEVHSTVGAGATTGGTMDLATLIKPVLSAGELRVVGSTTFEEFKQIEKDRGARPPAAEDRRRRAVGRRDRADSQGPAVTLRAAPQRALHGRRARRRRQAGRAAPARFAAARQRHRHPRRSRRHAAPAAGGESAFAGRGCPCPGRWR